MPISGPVVHQQLMDAYTKTQADFEAARGETSEAKERRDELKDGRGEALVRLAEHYLPELTPQAVRETWAEIRDPVSEVLLRKEEHAQRAQKLLNGLTAQRHQQDQQMKVVSQELDEAVEAQQEIVDQVSQTLQQDQHFVRLSDQAAIAEAALERAEANLHEIDQDSARKLPAYESSSLFHYLYQRQFGTSEYTQRGFTRRMDRWLAKFIDFNKAKQSYEFLRKTPEQMRTIIAEDRQALDTVMDELERNRDQVAARLGLPERILRTQELDTKRAKQLKTLDEVLRDTDKTQSELSELEDTRGPYYREAIKLFRETLEKSDSRDLKRRAQQTEEITDDQIVARLQGVESEIGDLDQAARRRRGELNQMQSFLQDLGRVIQRFRAAQFDSSRSKFVGSLDIFEELERAREENDIDLLWRRIRRSQRWGSVPDDDSATGQPLAQVLINAMGNAAGDAKGAFARRAGGRRAQKDEKWGGDSGSGTWGGDSSGD